MGKHLPFGGNYSSAPRRYSAPDPSSDELEAYNLLARSRGQLLGTYQQPAIYPGNREVPMSNLTQRQRQLQTQWQNKVAPYSNKANAALARPNQGFSPDQIQGMLSQLQGKGKNLNQSTIKNFQKIFGDYYRNNPREEKLRSRGEKIASRESPTAEMGLKELGLSAQELERAYNSNLASGFNNLGEGKTARREELSNLLGQFGKQNEMHSHLNNIAGEQEFNRELNAPFKKQQALARAIQGNPTAVDNPIESANNQGIIRQAINNYNTPHAPYRGQMVADMPYDMQKSHNMAAGLNPKYQDQHYQERKALEKDLLNREGVGTRAINKLSEATNPLEESYNRDYYKRLKQDLAGLDRRFEAEGLYGTGHHLKAREKRAKELEREGFTGQSNIMQHGLGKNLNAFHTSDIGDINRMGLLGKQGNQEFGSVINKIKGLNELGAQNFANQQGNLNRYYSDFLNQTDEDEKLRNKPHLLGQLSSSLGYGGYGASEMYPGGAQGSSGVKPNILQLQQLAQASQPSVVEKPQAILQQNANVAPINNINDAQIQQKKLQEESARQAELARVAEANRVAEADRLVKQQQEQERQAEAKRVEAKRQYDWKQYQQNLRGIGFYETPRIWKNINEHGNSNLGTPNKQFGLNYGIPYTPELGAWYLKNVPDQAVHNLYAPNGNKTGLFGYKEAYDAIPGYTAAAAKSGNRTHITQLAANNWKPK